MSQSNYDIAEMLVKDKQTLLFDISSKVMSFLEEGSLNDDVSLDDFIISALQHELQLNLPYVSFEDIYHCTTKSEIVKLTGDYFFNLRNYYMH